MEESNRGNMNRTGEDRRVNPGVSKTLVQLLGFFLFFGLYLVFFNLMFHLRGGTSTIYVPGTLLFSLLGYWLGGYFYDRFLK